MHITKTVARLWRETRGNFAVIGALTAVPLILVAGGAIDFSMFYSVKVKIQNAADGAALAAAKQFPSLKSDSEIQAFAANYFDVNTASLYRTTTALHYDGTTWDENNTRELKIHVDYDYDPMFLRLPMSTSIATKLDGTVASAVAIGETTVEVALVLDTSGSMSDRPTAGGDPKIVTLRSVAEKAVSTLFSSASGTATEEPVQVAVVPFSGAVNVGTQFANASWMDREGRSSIHHENFDWATWTDASGNAMAVKSVDGTWRLKTNTSVFLTRQYVLANARIATNAQKCVWNGKRYPYSGDCTWVETSTGWVFYKSTNTSSSYQVCKQSSTASCKPGYAMSYQPNPAYAWQGCVEMRPGDLKLTDDAPGFANPNTFFVPYFSPDEPDDNSESFRNSYLKDIGGTSFLKQQSAMNKYLLAPEIDNAAASSGDNRYTPNYACSAQPLVPLTANKATVTSSIRALEAVDSTNVTEGVAWGWRALSPREPFTAGRAIGDEKNVKAMIVMTDGANTYYPQNNDNRSRFGALGFSDAGHLFDIAGQTTSHTTSGFATAMDKLNAKVCDNAKNDGRVPLRDRKGVQFNDSKGPVTRDGVMIYTIAFDIPASDANRVDALLKACASYSVEDLKKTGLAYADKSKHFYRAGNAAELDSAFTEILASLSNLRVSH